MNEWWVWKADRVGGPPIDGTLHLTYAAVSWERRPLTMNCGIRISHDLCGTILISQWWLDNVHLAEMENLKDCQPCLECIEARP